MKVKVSFGLCIAVILLGGLCVTGQTKSSAKQALTELKLRLTKKVGRSDFNSYIVAAVSVEKYLNTSLRLNFSVAVGPGVKLSGPLMFDVEPVATQTVEKGMILKHVGQSARLKTEPPEREQGDVEELTLNPQIIVPFSAEADAVRIRITGLATEPDKAYTLIIPIADGIRSAALGGIIEECNGLEGGGGPCQWYTSYCETGCPVLCVGCSNQNPTLNCASCSMSCVGGQTCTPNGPRPLDCPS